MYEHRLIKLDGSVERGVRVALLVVALTAILGAAGCGPGRVSQWKLDADIQRPQPGAVIFLVDGLPPRMLEEGCKAGWLPNLDKRFYAGGTHVRRAVTAMPSITYAAIGTLVTGVSPGTHGILGNRWFDREQMRFRDYATIGTYDKVDLDYTYPTIYERIAPAASATVQTVHRRGATHVIRNWAMSGAMWFFQDYTAVDKLTASSLWRVAAEANRRGRWPTLVTFYFPGLDTIGHEYGASHLNFRLALEHIDHQVGRVCDWLEREGLLESTYLLLLSDHGMVDVDADRRIDLLRLVRDQWGHQATNQMKQDGSDAARRKYYEQFETVIAHQDGRGASLHFRGTEGWEAPPPNAEVAARLNEPRASLRLWNVPGVALVAYLAGEHEAIIRSPRGQARILRQKNAGRTQYAYIPRPDDVLGYLDNPELAGFVAGGFHDSRSWLRATADEVYPDVVPRLIHLLHHRRAGQVVMYAEPGYSFVHEHGGHGSIHRDEMLMTFCIAGPGIQAGRVVDTARAVDVVPTLLDLLDVENDDPRLEGVSLLRAGVRGRKSATVRP